MQARPAAQSRPPLTVAKILIAVTAASPARPGARPAQPRPSPVAVVGES